MELRTRVLPGYEKLIGAAQRLERLAKESACQDPDPELLKVLAPLVSSPREGDEETEEEFRKREKKNERAARAAATEPDCRGAFDAMLSNFPLSEGSLREIRLQTFHQGDGARFLDDYEKLINDLRAWARQFHLTLPRQIESDAGVTSASSPVDANDLDEPLTEDRSHERFWACDWGLRTLRFWSADRKGSAPRNSDPPEWCPYRSERPLSLIDFRPRVSQWDVERVPLSTYCESVRQEFEKQLDAYISPAIALARSSQLCRVPSFTEEHFRWFAERQLDGVPYSQLAQRHLNRPGDETDETGTAGKIRKRCDQIGQLIGLEPAVGGRGRKRRNREKFDPATNS